MANLSVRERRKFVRIYRRIGVNIVGYNNKKTEPKLDEEVGHDISLGGILLECSKRIPVGSALRLKIMLTFDDSFRMIRSGARVVWNKRSFRDTYYLGCKFSRIDQKERAALIRFIKDNLP